MPRFHLAALAACLAVICCLEFNALSTITARSVSDGVIKEPKTILSDDFLTMSGDNLLALKEYVTRLIDYKPQSNEEYEKWVRVRESIYSSLLDASEKLLKIATEPADIALGQKGKLVVLENTPVQREVDDDILRLKAFADALIREAPRLRKRDLCSGGVA